MAEQDRLEALRVKIHAQVKQKEDELKELKQKLHIIDSALGLLFDEGEIKAPGKVVEIRRDKYKDMKMQDAVLDCVNNYGATRELSPNEVMKHLKENGIQSKSKHIYSTVFITLKRLADKGLVLKVQGKGFRRKEQAGSNDPVAKQVTL
jgi:hypothetical protein